MHWKIDRQYVWTMIGADVKNGLWAVLEQDKGIYDNAYRLELCKRSGF